ncbi:MAG: hypothetical protein IJY73_10040 [Oscillospiraceae bacterium]|nr:hypothetical protein [Oscillospiraceae bacterium]
MGIKGKYSESAPLYAAFLSAGAVAAIAVFAIIMNMNADKLVTDTFDGAATTTTTAQTEPQGYSPDEQLSVEMKDSAIELLGSNYEVLKLYFISGLDHKDEPYGNAPEDGYYTVDDSEYTTLAQLEALVDSTFVPDQAQAIKENSLGYGPVYKERDGGELGIFQNFTPMPYEISWDNPQFKIDPVSDEECVINVTLHNRSDGAEVVLKGEMVKTEDGWRLKTILY